MNEFTCTKRFPEICVAHRNWKSNTHCSKIHGYARTVEITIGCDELAAEDWVIDFGSFKTVRKFIEDAWDHRFLVSDDDPLLEDFKVMETKGALDLNIMDKSKGWGPSLEQSCKFLADHINPIIKDLTNNRCRLVKIEIWEKSDNKSTMIL